MPPQSMSQVMQQMQARLESIQKMMAEPGWTPEVNRTSTPDGGTRLEINLAGLDRSELTVTVQNGVIHMLGLPHRPVEGHTGKIVEDLDLPAGVDPAKVSVNVYNGILGITFPPPESKSVPVGGGN